MWCQSAIRFTTGNLYTSSLPPYCEGIIQPMAQMTNSYVGTPGYDPIMEFVSPLVCQSVLITDCIGTAVIVGPYLAFTARHVIEDYARTHGVHDIATMSGDVDAEFNLLIFQTTEEISATWSVAKIYVSPATDIAVLFIKPGNEDAVQYKFRPVYMDLHPPYPGTQVSGFGYPASKISRSETDSNTYELDLRGHTTIGEVTTVYRSRRDSFLLNYPCFEVNARVDGGMSGGPVFDQRTGSLLGLMCTSWEFQDADSATSYIASLWPIMPILIDIPRAGRSAEEKYRLLELASSGVLGVKNWDRMSITSNGDGTENYEYKHDKGFASHSE